MTGTVLVYLSAGLAGMSVATFMIVSLLFQRQRQRLEVALFYQNVALTRKLIAMQPKGR